LHTLSGQSDDASGGAATFLEKIRAQIEEKSGRAGGL
jgi:hypothetical protein